MLVTHLDEASSPSGHSHYSHPFFKFHRANDPSFFDEDEYDEYDEFDDEYYESDDEVAFYLSVKIFHLEIMSLRASCIFFRYVFEDILRERYPYVNRNPR